MSTQPTEGGKAPVPATIEGEVLPPEIVLKRAPHAVVSEFQSDAVELEERLPSRVARTMLYAVTLFIASAILWASFSSLDEVVVAQGKLVTTKPTIVLQPLETSIVRDIRVAPGDVVRRGDRLATLDPTFTDSAADQQNAKFAALDAQIKRIEAELDNRDYNPGVLPTEEERLQFRQFGQRRAFYVAQLQNFDQQIAGQAATIRTAEEQSKILQARVDTLGQIETVQETLYKREVGSLLNMLSARDTRFGTEAALAQTKGQGTEAFHALAKLKADRQAFIEDFRRAAVDQLVDLRSQRDAVSEEIKRIALRRKMVTLEAPADAVVLELAQRSIGSVVREAEPMITLVPLDVPLEAEVAIRSRDVARIATGEAARVKFDAYPFQKFGTWAGIVRTVSRDAFAADPSKAGQGDPSEASVFRGRVQLADAAVGAPNRKLQLLPGMTVSAEIKVGQRRVISYFLYPIMRGLDESLREP
ncbi:MAG: HlyD family type I secretion periplasmic adaptor subunit [Methylobacterium mesophilicum]|nr:HlyD family type I secretion periplasmic adaptor subunit [Methylobacterium mesophilicum]